MRLLYRSALLAVLCLSATALFAQGTTGILVGTAMTEGNPLPGVTVTISSPALQGTRTTTTGDAGGYLFPGLPPGNYTVTFDLEGMQRVEQSVTVSLAQTSRADANLRVMNIAEAITITAAAPAAVETTEVASNFDYEMVRELPTGRDIKEVVYLAAGVTDAAPNDQITISGAFSFDNLFLVNGVIVNENLRGQPHDLFIEDAIQETTVLSGGVSAEFGRFTGGVVSTLTKSGGNDLSGSLRDTLTNPSWTADYDFPTQPQQIDELNNAFEATLGGKLIHDRLWYFGAGRLREEELSKQLRLTNIPYVEGREDRRWEAKLTGQIAPQHTVVGSFLQSAEERSNYITFSPNLVVDERSLVPYDRTKELFAIHYSGVLSSNWLLEGQYSRMDDDFVRGSTTRDLIEGTLLRDATTGFRMWSSSGCGAPCGVKQHDNKDALLKASYFLSTRSTGNHSFVGGVEEFHQLRLDNNIQSGSDFWLHGHIIQDPNDRTVLYWGIDPNNRGAIEWDPVARPSQMSDFAVRSVFLNDKWDLNEHWHFNVGVRYDQAFGENQDNIETVDTDAWSPRLAAAWDPQGNGRHRFSASYGRYVSKVDQGPGDLTTQGGRYSYYLFNYEGPAINPIGTPINQMVPIPQAIQMVFNWFNSVGGTTNIGLLDDVSVQGYSERYEGSVQMPWMDEITLGYAVALGSRGFLRTDLIDRSWGDFYVIRRTLETGIVQDPTGLRLDQGVIENSDDGLSREYQAVQVQGAYRFGSRINVGGNYTWSELTGNVVGEAASGATTLLSHPNRPEYTGFPENNRVGFLPSDMRHRANLWVQFDIPLGFGDLNLSLLDRYHSALSHSALGTIDVRRATSFPQGQPTNLGYVTVPTNVTYYFAERGAFRVDDINSTDLGVNFTAPVGPVRLFAEFDLLNMFNEQGIEDPDFVTTTILTHRQTACRQTANNQPCARFNPLAGDVPVEGVHWQKSATFGRPSSIDAYQLPRTYRVSLGVRF